MEEPFVPLTEEPDLKPEEHEHHEMSARRKAASQKANEAKRVKRLKTEALMKSLQERDKLHAQQVAAFQSKHDTLFADLVAAQKLSEALKLELEKRQTIEKKDDPIVAPPQRGVLRSLRF